MDIPGIDSLPIKIAACVPKGSAPDEFDASKFVQKSKNIVVVVVHASYLINILSPFLFVSCPINLFTTILFCELGIEQARRVYHSLCTAWKQVYK